MTIGTQDWTGLALASGRYLITAKLGEGGMGAVYRAKDQNIEADVVIKVPLRSMLEDPEFSRRFKDEIRSLVRLSHPHIVKVSDVGECDGLPFAVMQFLPGGSLEDRRPAGPEASYGASDPRELGGWLGGIAGALDYVHSQGYVHRDVKPGNILFDAQGHPFLGDFGVVKVIASSADSSAKSTRAAMTGAGMVVGTAEYMAQELIMGDVFDGRVDQYALAVTVFEMLCGQLPFHDEVKTKILVLQTTKPPPIPHELCGWIPAPVSEAVLKGLAKDPADRYPNCAALASAVLAAVEAGFAGQPERIRFKCRACGKNLAIPPADYAKLRKTGRSLACPACKAPFRVPAEGTPAEGPDPSSREHPRGGTMVETPQASAGEYAVPDGAGSGAYALAAAGPNRGPGTMVEQPGLKRGPGTMIEQPGLKRGPGTMVEQPGLKRGPGTMVEQPGLKRGPGTMVEQPGLKRGPGTMIEQPGLASRAVEDAEEFPNLIRPGSELQSPRAVEPVIAGSWAGSRVVIGVSAGVSMLAIIVLAVWFLMPRSEDISKSNGKRQRPSAGPVVSTTSVPPAIVAPSGASRPSAGGFPTTPETPAASRASQAGSVAETEDPPAPSGPGLEEPKESSPSTAPRPSAELARAESLRPGMPPLSTPETPAPTPVADIPWRTFKPVKGAVPLERILKSPESYIDKLVVPTRVFCIGNTCAFRPDGSASLPIIEGILDLKFNGRSASIVTKRAQSFVVDLDPKLAGTLIRMGRVLQAEGLAPANPSWGDNVAIVTLAVSRRPGPGTPECDVRIVKFEFLVDIGPRIVVVAGKRKRRVVYQTLTLTADGEDRSVGKPEDWAQNDRLLHIANQFKDLIDNEARQMSDAKWQLFNNQVNGMISQGIRNATPPPVEMPRPRRVFP